MRAPSAAVIAVALAVVWLGAIAVDSAAAVGLVTVAAMATPVLLAPRRRRRAVYAGAVGIALSVAALVVATMACPGGAGTLAAMAGGAVVVAVIVPVVYAVTFGDDPRMGP